MAKANAKDRASKREREAQEAQARRCRAKAVGDSCCDYLTRDLSRGTGRVLADAAPIVFQGMCRREGIRVYFTETPKTDGRAIWLGPIDFTEKLANVYVYGHGCHERHHIRYSDFETAKKAESELEKRLFNLFEDVRVDMLGAKDYSGYLLWRRALFRAYEASGSAPWMNSMLTEAESLLSGLHLFMLSEYLGFENFESIAEKLLAKAGRVYGDETTAAVLGIVKKAVPMESSEDALAAAREVKTLLEGKRNAAHARLSALSACRSGFTAVRALEGQGSLFDENGDPSLEAEPIIIRPGYLKARSEAEAYAELFRSGSAPEDEGSAVRRLLTGSASYSNDDDSLGALQPASASENDYTRLWERKSDEMRKLFRSAWMKSASVRNLFQAALEHALPRPMRWGASGFELDDRRLALLAAGEDRVFVRDLIHRGREIAVKILIDTSGSMDSETITTAKVTAMRLLEALRAEKGFHAAVDLFPGATQKGVTRVAGWETSLRDAVPQIDFVEGFGQTPIIQALYTEGVELDARPDEKKAVFVITDGIFMHDDVKPVIDMLRSRGILTAMVGIGSLSTPMGDFTAKTEDVSSIPKAVARVVADLTRTLRTARI